MYDLCPLCGIIASPPPAETICQEVVDSSAVVSLPLAKKHNNTIHPVVARLQLLQMLNRSLLKTLPFIDLTNTNRSGSVASLLSRCRGLILVCLKNELWEDSIDNTKVSNVEPFELQLSRFKAAKHSKSGIPDDDAKFTCFSQAFRQFHNMSCVGLRHSDRIYRTLFIGEKAIDAGGPYRESIAMYCQELQSSCLSLMMPTPNARHSFGQNRDQWILNPGNLTLLKREMLIFLGKLMGIAIRGKEYLALNLSPIIWKLLVGETLSRDDLEGVDKFQVTSLEKLRDIDKEGIDAEMFQDIFFENFTVISTDNRVVELISNGANVPVTFQNRHEYCDLVISYRLKEFDESVKAVREGLNCIVPLSILTMFSWDQLERMVCGKKKHFLKKIYAMKI